MGQVCVYINRHIDVYLKVEKVVMEQNTKHTARKIQRDRQVDKKAYTHVTN